MSLPLSNAASSLEPAAVRTIVVIGGGIQGASVAYYLAKETANNAATTRIVVLESKQPAAAASGKGGGFMARSWGDGTPTQELHQLAFDLYEKYATTKELQLSSYRKLPVLSVSPGKDAVTDQLKRPPHRDLPWPRWLDGQVGSRIALLGGGDDTAQVTPAEVVERMLSSASDQVEVILGTCVGVESAILPTSSNDGSSQAQRRVTGVKYVPRNENSNRRDEDASQMSETVLLPADVVCVSAGPWSCAAEEWFKGAVKLPMEGIKSASIVWKPPSQGPEAVDATALFCGEDNRFGTHLEVYPRPDGTIYICGIGGSDYITAADLKKGAFREECPANESRVAAAVASFHTMSAQYQAFGELERSQACMRPCPPDALPYMGRVPGYEGAYLNAGHNCWGIAWAPACGMAMAELIQNGESECIDLSPFDPARFTPTAAKGNRGRKQRGVSVGEQW